MDGYARKLRRIGTVDKMRRNCIMFSTDLPLRGSEFQRVGAATETALVPVIFICVIIIMSQIKHDFNFL